MKRDPVAYPPDFFTSLVRAHNFPPGFESRLEPPPVRHRTERGKIRKSTAPLLDEKAREEAIRKKLNRYWSGRPCAKGHDAERYTSTRGCCECQREANERMKLKAVRA